MRQRETSRSDHERTCPVVRALRFVDAHLDGDLSLARVASHVGLSRYHFARLFRRETRTSLKRHVIARRLERARVLLLLTDQSLADVAYEVGFGSQSHMTTLFAKHQGCTPARLRRERLADRRRLPAAATDPEHASHRTGTVV